MAELLSDAEMSKWVTWKRATEMVLADIESIISSATGLSAGDFAVLTRVVEEPGQRIRQQRLSDQLGWERSRLSKHLDRMANRGLISRDGNLTERTITPTSHGTVLAHQARVIHADAVRSRLLTHVPELATDDFWLVLKALSRPAAS
ncbi:MarR family winged helix-turn-helix transcriptional regulator [Frondihabitans cladoniiphilus]|uniref:MarR family transcriptional regulator n=1 Tax=Frondihabitans cladoniiphilus TaxID=715785 RepID=A0ABP8W660_9MICO